MEHRSLLSGDVTVKSCQKALDHTFHLCFECIVGVFTVCYGCFVLVSAVAHGLETYLGQLPVRFPIVIIKPRRSSNTARFITEVGIWIQVGTVGR